MSAEDFQLIDDSKINDSIKKRILLKYIINTEPMLIMKFNLLNFNLEKNLITYK